LLRVLQLRVEAGILPVQVRRYGAVPAGVSGPLIEQLAALGGHADLRRAEVPVVEGVGDLGVELVLFNN
jgi:hypothetical protein